MRAWLLALRIARREAGRAKRRTTLVVTMIGLPIMALSFALATVDMARLTRAETVTRQMGTADAILSWPGQSPVREDLGQAADPAYPGDLLDSHTAADALALLPAGSIVSEIWQDYLPMRTADGGAYLSAEGIDLTSPLTRGIARVVSGRAPVADGEVAVTAQALASLGIPIGDTFQVFGSDTRYTVVGTVEISGRLDEQVVFHPSLRPGKARPSVVPPDSGFAVRWLVGQGSPVLPPEIARLNAAGAYVQSRALILDPPPAAVLPASGLDRVQAFGIVTVLVGMAGLEIVLLAGPAFAVGARRRQRSLALVAAAGGTPAMLRRIVLADGVVGGLLAAVAGVVAGIGLALAGRPLVEEHLIHQRMGGVRVYPWAVAALVAVAVGVGLLAALAPAITAARKDVVSALAGRRGIARSRRRWFVVGAAVAVLGAVVAGWGAYQHTAGLVLAGLAANEIGLVACTPTLVGLIARLGRFLPLAPRLALRDTARRRAAAAPAISAVMAAVAGSVAVTVYLSSQLSSDSRYALSLPYGSIGIATAGDQVNELGTPSPVSVASLAGAVHEVLPDATVVGFRSVGCHVLPSGGADDGARTARPPHGACDARLVMPEASRCPYSRYAPLDSADQRRALADARCNGSPDVYPNYSNGPYVTDSPQVVAALTGLSGASLDTAVATLRAGGILVTDARYVHDGHAILGWFSDDAINEYDYPPASAAEQVVTVPAYAIGTGIESHRPIYGPAALAAVGGTAIDAGVVVTPHAVPTVFQEQTLKAVLGGVAPETFVYVERGDQDRPPVTPSIPVIIAIAAGIIALGAAGIATGLAASEGREELSTLAAIGAGPAIRRVLALAQAATISGLGAVIGAVAGFGAAAAVLTGLNHQWKQLWPVPPTYHVAVPWLDFAVTLGVVPLVAMVGAGLLVRSRLPSERRAG